VNRRGGLTAGLVIGAVMSVSGCSSAPQTPSFPTVTVHDTTTAGTIPVVSPQAGTDRTTANQGLLDDGDPTQTEGVAVGAENGGSGTAIMPDVVCHNLQAAQDEIQEAGVFYSRSIDASGKGRHQVLDSNWVVVSQRPAPGTPIGEGDVVLSVVKNGEPGSC